jgi:putative drug exporter of the RND superfamily
VGLGTVERPPPQEPEVEGQRSRSRIERAGLAIFRRRKWILAGAVVFVIVAAGFGASAASRLSQGGFDADSEQSVQASHILQGRFGVTPSNVEIIVTARSGTVDSPSVRAAGLALTRRLASLPHVDDVKSYWSEGSPPQLRSSSSREALLLGTIEGNEDQVVNFEPPIARAFLRVPAAVTVKVGGFGPTFNEVNTVVERDLVKAEAVAVPLTLVLLLFVFGSLVSALLPLVVAGVSTTGTLLALRIITSVTPVSIFALNMTTVLGLGLAIDYSLFIVSRYREEIAAGRDVDDAVARTLATAGRTVAGSALTVAASLSALAVFPIMFLRSFAFAGIAVALLSGIAAVVVLPAVLGALGHRVNNGKVWTRSVHLSEEGFWSTCARKVMRRPWLSLLAGVAVLGVLGSPVVGIRLGYFDTRALAPSDHVRQVDDQLSTDFGPGQDYAVFAVPRSAGSSFPEASLDAYAARLSDVHAVAQVATATGIYQHGLKGSTPTSYLHGYSRGAPGGSQAWLSITPSIDAMTPAGVTLVDAVRAVPAPVPMLVGGSPANYADSDAVIFRYMPLCLLLIAVVMLGLLLLLFRSIVLPIKALILNILSMSATFGAMVWIFQDGHFSGLLDFTPTGSLIATMPILMFCVAFGLSMDYEVFLVSRIKEHHDNGLTDEDAVARGLQQSGRIITAAAILMSIVFLSVVSSVVSFIKLFGLGLTLAVLVDALLIRAIMVPAFMKLAGAANWWMPSRSGRRAGRSAS